jgi:hypothetical protein
MGSKSYLKWSIAQEKVLFAGKWILKRILV